MSPYQGVGQVGLGGITVVHRQGYRKLGIPVVAGFDPDEGARLRFQLDAPEAAVYSSLEELLADTRVAVIDLATPHHRAMRLPALERIAEARKPVLLQKPLAMNYAEALEVVELVEGAGVKLMVNQNMCFAPGALALEQALLIDNAVGPPAYAQMIMQYCFDTGNHPWFGRDDRWWTVGLTVHHLGLLHVLHGPPERVYATIGQDTSQPGVSTEGYGHLALSYPSGLQVMIISTGTYYGLHEVTHQNEACWVQGPKGLIDWNPNGPVTLSTRNANGEMLRSPLPTPGGSWFPDAFGLAMEHFQQALAQQADPLCSGPDNLYVMATVEAAYRSASEGRSIHLSDVMNDLYDPEYGTGWSHGLNTWEPPRLAEAGGTGAQ